MNWALGYGHGESYVSEAVGSLGKAMRGKTPVFDAEGNIIGIVSVGFMLDRVAMDVVEHTSLGWWLVAPVITASTWPPIRLVMASPPPENGM